MTKKGYNRILFKEMETGIYMADQLMMNQRSGQMQRVRERAVQEARTVQEAEMNPSAVGGR